MNSEILFAIESFAVWRQTATVAGWAFSRDLRSITISVGLPGEAPLNSVQPRLPSQDVAAVHGAMAENCRFSIQVTLRADGVQRIQELRMVLVGSDGQVQIIEELYKHTISNDTNGVLNNFLADLQKRVPGRFLEVGSRARSGVIRKKLVPAEWDYIGMDVLPGDNVDVVGDAHELSKLFDRRSFDAVFSISVLEHIFMPWKFVVELNRVLKMGGIGYLATHQSWPLHDAPWDFWRFSDAAWAALFNRATGFEIVEAQMGEPAQVVAERWHPIVHFGSQRIYLSSVVRFRKVDETTLDWPVSLEQILSTSYPSS